ncbi:MAG: hypothetical protein R2822_05635 [Spirosomataceae bacterium]
MKNVLFIGCIFMLFSLVVIAQGTVDTDNKTASASGGIDITSAIIGVVVGLVIGYVVGGRMAKK